MNSLLEDSSHPVLYSYRRCPYAMRARMAIYVSGLQVEQREIQFWNKPELMLAASPKGTVPVLVLPTGEVLEESRDIMLWALQQSDPLNWLAHDKEAMEALVVKCDEEFKVHLDHYKYADRHPEFAQEHYRQQGEVFLQQLETRLSKAGVKGEEGLFSSGVSWADIAIFPFIRQFVNVDKDWFATASYPLLRHWLAVLLEKPFFGAVMKNRPPWQTEHHALWLDEPTLQTKDQFRLKAQGL